MWQWQILPFTSISNRRILQFYERKTSCHTQLKTMNTKIMFRNASNEWETPDAFYDELNREFHFTLDPYCQEYSRKCGKYYTPVMNGLAQSWEGETVFCNPPYRKEIGTWVRKCYAEAQKSNTTVVMLIPARTDTKWFHDYIYQKDNVEIRFIKGRLKFMNRYIPPSKKNRLFYYINAAHPAPFPSIIVIFR